MEGFTEELTEDYLRGCIQRDMETLADAPSPEAALKALDRIDTITAALARLCLEKQE